VDERTKEARTQLTLQRQRLSVRGKRPESLWKHRGSALSDFLHQMKEHNAGVVAASSGTKPNGEQK